MSTIVEFPSQGIIGSNLQPKRYDIVLYQGDNFAFAMVFKNGSTPIDVTGWTVQGQIKKMTDGSPGETPSLDFTIGTTDGKITVSLTDTDTAALDGATEYKYDIQVNDGTIKRTFIGGVITVTDDITEWA